MGDYLGIAARGAKVYPVWTDNRTGTAMTYVSPYETNNLPRPFDLLATIIFETGEAQLTWQFENVPSFQYFIIYRGNVYCNMTGFRLEYQIDVPENDIEMHYVTYRFLN